VTALDLEGSCQAAAASLRRHSQPARLDLMRRLVPAKRLVTEAALTGTLNFISVAAELLDICAAVMSVVTDMRRQGSRDQLTATVQLTA
jgi:hypothetical protein